MAERDRRDIERRSFEFAVAVVRLARSLPADAPAHLVEQVVHLGTGIGAHVAEAQASSSRRRHLSSMNDARRYSSEIAYWLQLLVASELAKAESIAPFLEEAQQLHAVLVEICLASRQTLEAEPDTE